MAPAEYTVMSGAMPQVLHFILSHVPVVDVCRLSSVCREWHKVAETNQLWKHLCHRDGINLQDLVDPDSEEQRLCYKLYKEYMITLKKWTTGQGVTTFSKVLQTPQGVDFTGRCLAITSDFIFAEQSRTVCVFSTSTGEYSHQLTALPAQPFDCRFLVSEDGTKAAAYARVNCSFICVWNVPSGECMHTLQHPANIDKMIMHANMIAVTLDASFGAGLFVWSMESGQLLHQLQGVHSADILVMDAHHIAVRDSWTSVVQLWEVNTGRHLFTWTDTDIFFLDVLLLDAGTNSLVGIGGGQKNVPVNVWDTSTGMRRATIQSSSEKYVVGQLIHEGKLLIAYRNLSDGMGYIEVVDLVNCADVLTSVNASPDVYSLAAVCMRVLSNGLLLAVNMAKDCVDVWDVGKRLFIRRINVGGQGQGVIECVRTSCKMLQVVLRNNSMHNSERTYKKFDFGS